MSRIDPNKLKLGDKVLLACEHHPESGIESMFVGNVLEGHYGFALPNMVLLLRAYDDGTLRDDMMRVIHINELYRIEELEEY